MPRFSIVIPTRNRARVLRHALSSALSQRFDDFEVVVSDNQSTDDTAAAVGEFSDSRLRYVRTGRDCSMPESWEFALGHARGEFITYLCDDDALCPGLLARVDDTLRRERARVVVWLGASYADDSWLNPETRNRLFLPTFSREVFEHRSEDRLAELFRLEGYGLPMFVNSFCPKVLVDRVKAAKSRFFFGAAPDYSTAAVVLSQVDSFLFMDEVLSVGGATEFSIGMSGTYNKGGAFQRYLTEFGGNDLLRHVPLRLLTPHNLVADTVLEVRDALGGKLLGCDFDWARYFVACYAELLHYETAGLDIEKERNHFFEVLDRWPAAVQTEVRAGIAAIPQGPTRAPMVIDCERERIRNIAECARYVETVGMTSRGRVKKAVVRLAGRQWAPTAIRWARRISRGLGRA